MFYEFKLTFVLNAYNLTFKMKSNLGMDFERSVYTHTSLWGSGMSSTPLQAFSPPFTDIDITDIVQ